VAELQEVDAWLDALLAGLEPAARKRMMRELAQQLRRSQQKNIRMQRNPDGTAYEPRRVTARTKLAAYVGRCLPNSAPQNT
jgi:phage virion morphogenesis protein